MISARNAIQATISFEALERWSYPNVREHTYRYISDQEITEALNDPSLADFELNESWGLLTDNHSTRSDNPVHPKVVARLVLCLRSGDEFDPVKIVAEPDIQKLCSYCVTDGHHRLRALQYAGITSFSALLCGCELAVKDLVGEEAAGDL